MIPRSPDVRRGGPSIGLRLAALLLVTGAAAGLAQVPAAGGDLVVLAAPCLNLRPGPALTGEPLRCLPPGRRVTLLETHEGWGRVQLPDGQVGWVALRLLGPATDLPPLAPATASTSERAPARPEETRRPPPSPGLVNEVALAAAAPADAQASRRIAELEEALAAAEAEHLRLEAESAEAQHRITELEEALAAAEAERLGLEAQSAERRAAAGAEAQRRIEDLEGRLRAAEMFLAESESQRREFARQLTARRQQPEPLPDGAGAEAVAAGPSGTEPPAAEPSAAAPPGPPNPPGTADIMAMVNAWAEAWSKQRVDDYLSFYAGAFQPPAGTTRQEWAAQRRERLLAPARISVRAALMDLRTVAPDRAEVDILQSYSSDQFSDTVVKTLELVVESGRWKIVRETSKPG
jgi:hypothetical protein